ncbi:hypothetical protein SDC9_72647 [bioreactor metagenome]|uniref:Uncharacterized protein n=1 Tax=bioreactor metagenome TaxID=1076179 RepID=A0A644YC57_9ZZZZ
MGSYLLEPMRIGLSPDEASQIDALLTHPDRSTICLPCPIQYLVENLLVLLVRPDPIRIGGVGVTIDGDEMNATVLEVSIVTVHQGVELL